jgi:hypothetical protein
VIRTAVESRRQATGERRFRRALLAIVVTLAVACAGVGAVGIAQGPRLSSMRVDEVAVTQQAGQQLRIFANQAIAQLDASQVRVEPSAAATVAVSGDVIAVTFGQALRYGTDYTVSVAGVTSPYVSIPSTITATFTTAKADAWLLARGVPDDAIVRTTLSGDRDQMYAGTRIQSFAVLKDALAIATVGDDHLSTLSITSFDGVHSEQLALPTGTSLRGLAVDPGGTVLGFQLTSLAGGDVAPDTLYLVDLEAGRTIAPVNGLDGAPLRALDWQFEPDGGILALTNEGMLTRIGADGIATPLGRANALGTISADGARAVVSESDGVAVLDLRTGSRTPLELDGLGDRVPNLDNAELLGDGSVVLVTVTPGRAGVTSELVVAGDGEPRVVFASTGGPIADFSISPNGQYAAVAFVPDISAAQSDLYGAEAMSTNVQTAFIELDTGKDVARMSGFGVRW